MIELRLLGTLQVSASDGRDVKGLAQQARRAALLAYLAAAVPRGSHSRDRLLALFWPELDGAHARAALSQALYVLRGVLGRQAILARSEREVGLDPAVVWCDAVAFETALDAGRPADALAYYRGDLLDGFFIPNAPEFERWLDGARERLRQRAGDGAWALAQAKAAEGDTVAAERWARWGAALLPTDEAVARRLMTFHHGLGDRAAAIRAYESFSRHLEHELELVPSTETQALAATIRREAQYLPPGRLTVPAPPPRVEPEPPLPAPAPAALTERARRPAGRWGPVAALLVLGGMAAALGCASLAATRNRTSADSRGPGVLILPFRNLGAAEHAHMADGITDEITARLAGVGGLRVIGGQAARRYAASDRTPRQIADEMKVDYVLEGTVTWLRSPEGVQRLRVRPRLVQARDGTQLWAAVLDRDHDSMTELFALLSEIADRVVDELDVAAEVRPRQRAGTIPTRSLEAYDYYLRGREIKTRSWAASSTQGAIVMFAKAVELDSTFALAHAWLSFAHTEAYWLNEMSAAHLDSARRAGERALRLDAGLPAAHLALGHHFYVCCEDYARALGHLRISHAANPGDPQVVMFLGNVHKRRGEWDEAIRYYDRAATLDPRWEPPLLNLAQLQLWLRRYAAAEGTVRRALAIDPTEAFAYTVWTRIHLLRDGDTASARRVVREAARLSDGFEGMSLPFYLELLDRDFAAALALAARTSPAGEAWDEWLASHQIRNAVVRRLLGDSSAARAHFDSARIELEREVRDAAPHSRRAHNILRSALATAYAGLGRRTEAIREAEMVLGSNPPAVDAVSGPVSLQNVALAYVLIGEEEAAVAILERLMAIPAPLSSPMLRLDPLWDPLRGSPRFQRLVRSGDETALE